MNRNDDTNSEPIDRDLNADSSHRDLPETDPRQAPEDSSSSLSAIASQLRTFQTTTELTLSSLVELFESRLASDAVKEKAFDRLYAELADVKRDREFEQMRPLFSDLVLLFDRLDHLGNQSLETEDASSIAVSIRDELLEILSRRGVDIVPTTEQFDPALQNALGTEPTCYKENNNGIARVVRRGFRYNSRVIRHEEVFVYRFAPGEMAPDDDTSTSRPDSDSLPLAPDQNGSAHD